METVNVNQTIISQNTLSGPILAGSNDRLRLTSEDGNKLAYYEKETLELRNDVLEYLIDKYPPIQESFNPGKNVFLSYFSEYKKNNDLFRAHFNYRSEGPWYDWVMIRWESNSRTKQAKSQLQECHVGHTETDQTTNTDFYILLVKSYALSLQNQVSIMPLSNAVILIFKEDLCFQLYGNKNMHIQQEVIKDLSYAT